MARVKNLFDLFAGTNRRGDRIYHSIIRDQITIEPDTTIEVCPNRAKQGPDDGRPDFKVMAIPAEIKDRKKPPRRREKYKGRFMSHARRMRERGAGKHYRRPRNYDPISCEEFD